MNLRLTLLAAGLALLPPLANALDPAADAAALVPRRLDARTRLGFERVRLPGGEKMGLVGLSELFAVAPTAWAGPAVYGAATGRRGGLFVPGVEAAWTPLLGDSFALDAGVFAGGGGGAGAPVGGGLMLRPHLDLVWRGPGFHTGPSYSLVRFVNGSISSRQWGWMLNLSSDFSYRRVEAAGGADRAGRRSGSTGRADGLGFDRIAATVTRLQPRAGTPSLSGNAPLASSIGLVGTRAERDWGGGAGGRGWWGIEAAGAASGGVAGYAEVLGDLGLRWPVISDRVSLGLHGALGLAGGGNIDTGGGILGKATLDAGLRLTNALNLSVEGGLVRAPRGRFDARSLGVALHWTLDAPSSRRSGFEVPAPAARMEWMAGAERYTAARKTGGARPLAAVTLAVNRFVEPWLYLSGQAHSAFAGGAGAYSVGLFGLGTQIPLGLRLRLGAEALAGAAGGGGVDTQGGALVQGRGYVDVALNDALSLRVGAGRLKSLHGGLNSNAVDAALVFRFGVDGR